MSEITLNSQPTENIHAVTKSYNASLSEINRIRRDLSAVFNNQDIEIDSNKLKRLDSFTRKRNPTSDFDLSTKYNNDDAFDGKKFCQI